LGSGKQHGTYKTEIAEELDKMFSSSNFANESLIK